MGAHASVYFIIKMSMITIILIIGGINLFIKYRKNLLFLGIMTVAFASLYIILDKHPPLGWFGSPEVW